MFILSLARHCFLVSKQMLNSDIVDIHLCNYHVDRLHLKKTLVMIMRTIQ